MRNISLFITAAVVALFALTSLSPQAAQADPATPAATNKVYLPYITGGSRDAQLAEDRAMSAQVLASVNTSRASVGCAPVTVNASLTAVAQAHAEDMANRRYFNHINPEGLGPAERATAGGYSWSLIGENIAAGQTNAQDVMFGAWGWMNSPGHRAHILDCRFTEVGIVHIYQADSPQGHYWVQLFGTQMR